MADMVWCGDRTSLVLCQQHRTKELRKIVVAKKRRTNDNQQERREVKNHQAKYAYDLWFERRRCRGFWWPGRLDQDSGGISILLHYDGLKAKTSHAMLVWRREDCELGINECFVLNVWMLL